MNARCSNSVGARTTEWLRRHKRSVQRVRFESYSKSAPDVAVGGRGGGSWKRVSDDPRKVRVPVHDGPSNPKKCVSGEHVSVSVYGPYAEILFSISLRLHAVYENTAMNEISWVRSGRNDPRDRSVRRVGKTLVTRTSVIWVATNDLCDVRESQVKNTNVNVLSRF